MNNNTAIANILKNKKGKYFSGVLFADIASASLRMGGMVLAFFLQIEF